MEWHQPYDFESQTNLLPLYAPGTSSNDSLTASTAPRSSLDGLDWFEDEDESFTDDINDFERGPFSTAAFRFERQEDHNLLKDPTYVEEDYLDTDVPDNQLQEMLVLMEAVSCVPEWAQQVVCSSQSLRTYAYFCSSKLLFACLSTALPDIFAASKISSHPGRRLAWPSCLAS
jgi:hypothetical protein